VPYDDAVHQGPEISEVSLNAGVKGKIVVHAHYPPFIVGDVLLLQTSSEFFSLQKYTSHFVLVNRVADVGEFLKKRSKLKMGIALGLAAIMVVTNAAGLMAILIAALITSLLMIITQCVTIEQAYKSINGPLMVTMAAAFGIAAALENTGTLFV
jgi:di/tricarboxylate transporter